MKIKKKRKKDNNDQEPMCILNSKLYNLLKLLQLKDQESNGGALIELH